LGVAGTHLPSDSSAFAAAVIGELAAVWGIAEKVAQDEALACPHLRAPGAPRLRSAHHNAVL